MSARILIVDDELVICKSCEKVFRRAGHETAYATSGRQALALVEGTTFDVVFTDLKMMDVGGMEVLRTVKQRYPDTVVVVITGYATIASAIETMRSGAFDYLPKPFTAGELKAVLDRALERRRLLHMAAAGVQNGSAPDDGRPEAASGFEGMIGCSPRMQDVYTLIRKVAPTDSTVLIVGESGTGKDLTARAIHNQSHRNRERFFAIDLTALPSTLLESELFGHVKGAYTGAATDRQGVFEAADRGTIFLDEIGNLVPETQARLLRVLQEKEVLPVGSTTVKKVDVRLILATNRNLKELVAAGGFREDLYYRLNVVPLRLPPLRERIEDIPPLTLHFLKTYCARDARPVPAIEAEALEALMQYHWPGNVRELEHVVERLVILGDGSPIAPPQIAAALFGGTAATKAVLPKNSEELKTLKRQIRDSAVDEVEKLFVREALIRNDWNVSQAAREVGMQRSNLQALMKKHGVRRPGPVV